MINNLISISANNRIELRKKLIVILKKLKYAPKFLSIILIAFIGVAIVYWIYKNESHKEESYFTMQLENSAVDRSREIQKNISNSIEMMYVLGQSIQQIVSNSKDPHAILNLNTFYALTQEAVVHNPYPSFNSIQWAPRVPIDQLSKFESKSKEEYASEQEQYKLDTKTNSDADYIFPVLYSQTLVGSDELGQDLYSEPIYKKYMDIAKDVGVATATSKIEIHDDNGKSWGFLIFLPIYSKASNKLDILERDSYLIGYLIEKVTIDNLVKQSLLNVKPSFVDFNIYDSLVENNAELMYSLTSDQTLAVPDQTLAVPEVKNNKDYQVLSKYNDSKVLKWIATSFNSLIQPLVNVRAKELSDLLKYSTDIDVGGFKWRIDFKLAPKQIVLDSSPIKWLLMITGLIITFSLCGYIINLMIHTVKVEREVRIRTKKLLTANHNLQLYSEELQELSEKLAKLANHDPLTGALNRRSFEHLLKEELYRAHRYNLEISVLMLDIDYFKKVNDSYGHQVGDELLIKCADIFKKRLRESDYLCRYGGEEFIFLLPHTDLTAATSIAESIRKSIESLDFSNIGVDRQVTVSLGVSNSNVYSNLDMKTLVLFADKGVYLSKENGRNQVRCFPPAIPASTLLLTELKSNKSSISLAID